MEDEERCLGVWQNDPTEKALKLRLGEKEKKISEKKR